MDTYISDSSPGISFSTQSDAGPSRYLKNEYPFLAEAHSQPLQQTLMDLGTAYKRAFDPKLPANMAAFKKKFHRAGIRFPQGFNINGKGVFLPKIGWIGFRKSREMKGVVKNVTVSYDGRHWYVTMQTERDIEQPVLETQSEVGIDVGIARFAALSDGTFVEGVNAFKK